MFNPSFTANNDLVVTPPPQLRMRVEASQQWFFENNDSIQQKAEEIVSRHEGQISQFWQAQQQNYRTGVIAVMTTQIKLSAELELQFQAVQNTTILTITVYPENTTSKTKPQVEDPNLDGYIVWVHDQPGFPDEINYSPAVAGPYDIYINDYLVVKDYQPTSQCEAVVIMFGPTALRCFSLQDPQTQGDPELNPLASKQNGGLAQRVIPTLQPPLPDDVAYDGTPLPKHNDLFGYYLFNWEDIRNPALMVQIGNGVVQRWDAWHQLNNFPIAKPRITQGVHFASALKSPLNAKGSNAISVTLSPGAANPELLTLDVLYAEFYDRNKGRIVQQSWTYATDATNSFYIGITDKPRQYGTQFNGVFGGQLNLGVDLTSVKNPVASETNALVAPTGYLKGSSAVTGISAAQQAALAAYLAAINASLTAWQNVLAPQIAAAVANIVSLTTLSQNATTTANNALIALETLQEQIVNAARSGDQAALTADEQQLPARQSAYTSAKAAADAAAASLNAAYGTLVALQSSLPPDLPARPLSAGLSIDNFKYRTVLVSGQSWFFGAWQNSD